MAILLVLVLMMNIHMSMIYWVIGLKELNTMLKMGI